MISDVRNHVERVCLEKRLGIPNGLVSTLTDICVGAFGTHFWDNPSMVSHRITGVEDYKHPLVSAMFKDMTPEAGVSEFLEMGAYLRALQNAPCLGMCLASLRNPREYGSTFFQLAMAFRLQRSGCEVELEPKTKRGRADIGVECEGAKYVAECYRLGNRRAFFMDEFEYSLFEGLFALVPDGRHYRFWIEIHAYPTYDGMRRLLKRAKQRVADFSQTKGGRVEEEFRGHVIGVEDITDCDDPDFDADNNHIVPEEFTDAKSFLCQTAASASSLFDLSRKDVTAVRKIRMSRVYLTRGYEKQWPKGPYSILESKLSRKLKQTKTDGGAKRCLFVDLPTNNFGHSSRISDADRKIQEQVVRKFDNVAGVFLMERKYGPMNRLGYRGVLLEGRREHAFPQSFFDKFNEVEMEDLFADE